LTSLDNRDKWYNQTTAWSDQIKELKMGRSLHLAHTNVLRLLLTIWIGMAASPLHAQLSTATINGTVRDASGSAVPQGDIVLRNVETGVEIRTQSNAAGVYAILNILPGSYTLSATSSGFGTKTISPLRLTVNQTATFDFSLELSTVQQTVTVEATGAEVQGSTAELGAVVASRQVVELPLNGRNFTQLLTLTPGASPVNTSQNSGGWLTGAVGQFTFPAING
jgi:hypothetical protein